MESHSNFLSIIPAPAISGGNGGCQSLQQFRKMVWDPAGLLLLVFLIASCKAVSDYLPLSRKNGMNDPENRGPFFKDQDPMLVTMCVNLHVNFVTREKLLKANICKRNTRWNVARWSIFLRKGTKSM